MKKFLFLVPMILLVAAGCFNQQSSLPLKNPQPKQTSKENFDGRLRIDSPKEGDAIGNSFVITGMAQNWFEGNIPIKVYDSSNNVLFNGNTTVPNNYDSPQAFSFTVVLPKSPIGDAGKIIFIDYSQKDGSVVYQKQVNIKFANEISDWKTYTNSQYGFEFRYPSEWSHEVDPANTDNIADFSKSQGGKTSLIKLVIFETQKNLRESLSQTIRSTIQEVGQELDLYSITPINSGTFAYSPSNGVYAVFVLIPDNSKGLILSYRLDGLTSLDYKEQDDIQIFKQILSTFKFTQEEFRSMYSKENKIFDYLDKERGYFNGEDINIKMGNGYISFKGDIKKIEFEGTSDESSGNFYYDGLDITDTVDWPYAIYGSDRSTPHNISFRCDGSLSYISKPVPNYYCQTIGNDYISQYEFSATQGFSLVTGGEYGVNWRKMYIRKFGEKYIFFFGGLSSFDKNNNCYWESYENSEKYKIASSKSCIDTLLKDKENIENISKWDEFVNNVRYKN